MIKSNQIFVSTLIVALLIGNTSIAQTSLPDQSIENNITDFSSGINSADPIYDVNQVNQTEWVFDMSLSGRGMRSARLITLNAATDYIADKLEQGDNANEFDFIDKVLLVDENFNDGTYTSKIRVLSLIEDDSFAINSNRNIAFNTQEAPSLSRPNWVLVVPIDIDEDQNWQLSGLRTLWASQWKIPFRDGLTQFIPATVDVDDKDFADNAESFEELSEYLMKRYKSEYVLYVARNSEGLVKVFQWGIDTNIAPPLEIGVFTKKPDVTVLRSAVLSGYWSSFAPSYINAEYDDVEGAPGVFYYRMMGTPKMDLYGYASGWIQLLEVTPEQWVFLENTLMNIRGLSIQSIQKQDTGLLINYRYNTEVIDDFETILSSIRLLKAN
jgi:hypothetical protein